jgi:protein involved in polysaccharide export with SLBB domain
MPKPFHSLSYCALTLSLLALAACAARPNPGVRPVPLQASAPPPYALQAGDLVGVKFYQNPELNEEVTIRPDGKISLQLIGDVEAAGLSPTALSELLTRRYTGELANPRISVIVRQIPSNQVYVGGEVGKPGTVPFVGGLTLYRALQAAGGLLKTAQRSNIVLIRRTSGDQASGSIVDIRPIASGERPDADVPLRASDIVVAPTSKIADVDIFVEQYIRNVLPITPGVALIP